MPRNEVARVGTTPVMLTLNDVTEVNFQNVGEVPVFVAGTVGSSAPPVDGSVAYFSVVKQDGFQGVPLADIFKGLTGVNRLWAWTNVDKDGFVSVSHA